MSIPASDIDHVWDSRSRTLLGDEAISRLAHSRVLVVGVGGVGGYTVEMLARCGVGHIAIVDSDTVAISNLNRQLIALHSTIGRPKCELLRERISDINPACETVALQQFVTADNAAQLLAPGYDFVADCIDTVASKVALLSACKQEGVRVISSMGAGGRIDPTRIRYADLWETRQDGLARAVRDAFKRRGRKPSIPVVFSDEAPCAHSLVEGINIPGKRTSYGSLATVTSVFGIYMASYIIKKL